MIDLNICIINTNNKDLLISCINSIIKYNDDVSYCIYLLDNASDDGTADLIEKMYPQVVLFRNIKKLGFVPNMNKMLNACYKSAKYTMMLNEDTEFITQNSFKIMIEYLSTHNNVAAVSPYIMYGDGSPQPGGRSFSNILTYFLEYSHAKYIIPLKLRYIIADYYLQYIPIKQIRVYLSVFKNHREPYQNVEVISGACMMIKKEALESVGLLDTRYNIYADDLDWCRMASMKGWKVSYLNIVKIIHYCKVSTSKNPFSLLESEKSMFNYLIKYNHNKYGIALLRIFIINIYIINIIASFLQILYNFRNYKKHYLYLKTYYKCIKIAMFYKNM